MAFIEERDRELGIIEDVMEKKEAVEVRIGHPFAFLPSSSSSSHHGQLTQHYFISSPAFDAGVGGDTSARSSGSGEAERPGEREHMFEKVVTPSDVGKLNRLVIPKQHAEKYFPLDSSATEKGLLLSFEDRSGKPWRFRYSYWNSSQSYVMTKGWSRFVKEKKLDAGDIVSFYRSAPANASSSIGGGGQISSPPTLHSAAYRCNSAALCHGGVSSSRLSQPCNLIMGTTVSSRHLRPCSSQFRWRMGRRQRSGKESGCLELTWSSAAPGRILVLEPLQLLQICCHCFVVEMIRLQIERSTCREERQDLLCLWIWTSE